MAAVLIEFENTFTTREGRAYEARACGRKRDDGLWEGWVEFTPADGAGPVLRTGRETTQPNREDLDYWAKGLTVGFLDGALDRALGTEFPRLRRRAVTTRPAFEGPRNAPVPAPHATPQPARAVLDPFAVYAEGDHVLRGQLGALDAGQLRNIIKAYDLSKLDAGSVDTLPPAELRALILEAVQRRA